MAQAISREEFEPLADELAAAGYEPSCVRPCQDANGDSIASIWIKGDREYRIRWDLNLDSARLANREMEEGGFRLRDIAFARSGKERRLTALWVGPVEADAAETQVLIGESLTRFKAKSREIGPGWDVDRFVVDHGGSDETPCCAIFVKNRTKQKGSVKIRARSSFGDRTPGDVKSDLRFVWLDPGATDRSRDPWCRSLRVRYPPMFSGGCPGRNVRVLGRSLRHRTPCPHLVDPILWFFPNLPV